MPILLEIGFFRLDTYTALGLIALGLFLTYTRKRAVSRGIDGGAAVIILVGVYVAGLLGAVLGDVIEKAAHDTSILTFSGVVMRSGATSSFGLLTGGLTAILLMEKFKVQPADGLEAAAIPLAFMFSIARVGCWCAGCCRGVGKVYAAAPWWGAHFPGDTAGFYRIPSQLMESAVSLLIAMILVYVDRKVVGPDKAKSPKILFPLFVLLYGSYRLVFDGFRELQPGSAFCFSRYIAAAVIAASALWLVKIYGKYKTDKEKE